MAIPKDAETLMGEIMCRWPQNIPFGPYQYSWFQNALASYAAHLAEVLPEPGYKKPLKNRIGEAIIRHDVSEAMHLVRREILSSRNEAIDACRAAILKDAGAGE